MSHRQVTDTHGHVWDVWEVNPTIVERSAHHLQVENMRVDRNAGFVGRVSEPLRNGWLAFQAPHEKRRMSPIPPGWDELPDAELLALLDNATKAGKPARLIE